MQDKSLVSVVIRSKNAAPFIAKALESIRKQTYAPIEIIVVDNFSTDGTVDIARRYTDRVFSKGPERAAQTNFGVKQAKGELMLWMNADFVLDPTCIEEAVGLIRSGFDMVEVNTVPDESLGFWARVKYAEYSCYNQKRQKHGVNFMRVSDFLKAGGMDESITGEEDFEMTDRIYRLLKPKTADTKAVMLDIDAPRSAAEIVRRNLYYGRRLRAYIGKTGNQGRLRMSPFRPLLWKHRVNFARAGVPITFGFFLYLMLKYEGALVGRLT